VTKIADEKIQPPSGIAISLVVPPQIRNRAPYGIKHVHSQTGELSIISADYSGAPDHILTFTAEAFSTYAIIHTEPEPEEVKPKPPGDNNQVSDLKQQPVAIITPPELTTDIGVPSTGDNSRIMLWVWLSIVAVFGLGMVLVLGRWKRNQC